MNQVWNRTELPGFLEQFNRQTVSGWTTCEGETTFVTIIFNDTHEFRISATRKRPDLPGNAAGFKFEVPSELTSVYPLKVHCVSSQGEALGNSPRIIETRDSEIQKVIHGEDSWLFLANDSNASIDYLTGAKQLADSLVEKWASLITARIDKMKARSIPFVQVLVAEKEVVYQDNLPSSYQVIDDRPATKLLDLLTKNNCLDYFLYGPTYQSARQTNELLYFKGDTHFSFRGAELVTRQLVEKLSRLALASEALADIDMQGYHYRLSYQVGDLISKVVGSNVEAIDYPISRHKPKLLFSTNEPRAGRVRSFINHSGNGRLLAFHTSSIDWMAPFLNDTFQEVLYIWGSEMDEDLVNWFRPDYVIAQTNERFLTNCPTN